MKLNIDLAEKWDMPLSVMSESRNSEVHYPQLHITRDEEIHLPKEGTMVIRYRKVGYSEHGKGDDMRYTCDIEVHKILSVEELEEVENPSKRDRSAEEALDKLASEKSKEKDY